jgi:putative PIN family toxin of toxin-antitoxin system
VRIVLDTNVLVSGLISPHGTPAQVLNLCRQPSVRIILSAPLLHEVEQVIARPHLQKYLPAGASEEMLESLRIIAVVLKSPLPNVTASPDPDDNVILATALAGQADLIISGDKKHLLSLRTFEHIPICSPSEAVTALRNRILGE